MDFRLKYDRKRPDKHQSRRIKREQGDKLKRMRGVAIGLSIPTTLIAGPVGGWFLGGWLDELFGTSWLALTLVILGTLGGFSLMIEMLNKLNKT